MINKKNLEAVHAITSTVIRTSFNFLLARAHPVPEKMQRRSETRTVRSNGRINGNMLRVGGLGITKMRMSNLLSAKLNRNSLRNHDTWKIIHCIVIYIHASGAHN